MIHPSQFVHWHLKTDVWRKLLASMLRGERAVIEGMPDDVRVLDVCVHMRGIYDEVVIRLASAAFPPVQLGGQIPVVDFKVATSPK